MLDDDDGAAGLDQLAEGRQELADVVEMEAGGGLVEDVENASPRLALSVSVALLSGEAGAFAVGLQMSRQLHALRLAARQRRGRLS